MTDLAWAEVPNRAELIARVRESLAELGSSLRLLAQDVLGADARIDLVAADPDGRIHLVLVSAAHDDLGLVALGLAQRAWVEARLSDWTQLAPQLGLRSDGPVRVVLVAPDFSPTAEAAVRAAGAEDFDLVRYRCLRSPAEGNAIQVLLEAVRLGGSPAGPPAAIGPPPASRFRTGLSDSDLVVSSEERRFLDSSPPGGTPGDGNRRHG
jgi:hypothetical protein